MTSEWTNEQLEAITRPPRHRARAFPPETRRGAWSDHPLRLAYRDFERFLLPWSDAGFVATDVDLVVRWFGDAYGLDERGAFMMLECKHGSGQMIGGQVRTFDLIDDLLELGAARELSTSTDIWRYRGFFTVWTLVENWMDCDEFVVVRNGFDGERTMNQRQFVTWLNYDIDPTTQCEAQMSIKPLRMKGRC